MKKDFSGLILTHKKSLQKQHRQHRSVASAAANEHTLDMNEEGAGVM